MNINEIKKRNRRKKPFSSVSHTTGDIELNIDRFNKAMGTAEGSEIGIGGDGALAEKATANNTDDIDTLVESWWKDLF